MHESPAAFGGLAHDFLLLSQSLKLERIKEIQPGSVLDKTIRLSNAVIDLRSAVSWMRFLTELVHQRRLPSVPTDTLVKPFRTFAIYRLSVKQRCSLLQAHYRIVTNALPSSVFTALWTGSRLPLGSLCGRRGGKYHLILEPSAHCGREGEYTFTLIAEDGFELAKLTFTLTNDLDGSHETQLLIGGLQGASSFFGRGGKDRVVAATRDLSGLRPKMVVFVAACEFAQRSGVSGLVAVSNRSHTINGDAWYQRRRLVADYDAFWIERGGVPVRWGFEMPLNLEPRTNSAARNKQRCRVVELVDKLFDRALPQE